MSLDELLSGAGAAREAGRAAEAEQLYLDALQRQPDSMAAHRALAGLLRDQGRLKAAERQLRRALRLKPTEAQAHNDLGDLYRAQEKFDQAAACYRRVIELAPDFAPAYVNLAVVLQYLDLPAEVPGLFWQALELDPDIAEARLGVGSALLQAGRIEEAVAEHRRAIALDPDLSVAYMTLAAIPGVSLSDRELAHLEGLLSGGELAEEDRSNLLFALAKAYESRGDFDTAFQRARAANEIDRSRQPFSAAAHADFIDRSIAAFPPDFFETRRGFGSDSQRPVFIVGLPRSGTTLVEQIVASHPEAFGGGELTAMPNLAKALPSRLWAPYPQCVARIDRDAAASLAERYLAALERLETGAARVTDKHPFNFRNLGLIALLFPKAKIIHCRRDPRDVALSCYFLKFQTPISFACDLADFGLHHRGYERLMAHWRRVLPLQILELDYEELVARQDEKSREIIAHCGLDWDPRCLAFHETDRTVRTASSWQVRQPIYARSVGRWRRYEKFLGPLLEALDGSE